MQRRVRELEAQLEAEKAKRSELEQRLADTDDMATSTDLVKLEESTYALLAQVRKELLSKLETNEVRAVRRMKRARLLTRRNSMETRIFWLAIAIVAVVGLLVVVGKLPAASFESTALALLTGVGALVVRNQVATKREDVQEDVHDEPERPSEPSFADDSMPPPALRRKRRS